MTRRGPKRSSSQPAAMVNSPATTFAAMAKTITSDDENPKVPWASTAPNVNTPASPMASTLGTKLRVISLSCVAAWIRLTTRPTTSATPSRGSATRKVTQRAC